MRRRYSFTVAIYAVMAALTFLFSFIAAWVPGLFLLPILIAAVCFDWKLSLFTGLVFGVASLVLAFIGGGAGLFGVVGIYFMHHPWLPILARLPIGIAAHFAYKGFSKVFNNKDKRWHKIVPLVLAAAIGTITNTFFVGLGIMLLPTPDIVSALDDITVTILVIFCAIEIGITAVLLPPLALALKRAVPRVFDEAGVKVDVIED